MGMFGGGPIGGGYGMPSQMQQMMGSMNPWLRRAFFGEMPQRGAQQPQQQEQAPRGMNVQEYLADAHKRYGDTQGAQLQRNAVTPPSQAFSGNIVDQNAVQKYLQQNGGLNAGTLQAIWNAASPSSDNALQFLVPQLVANAAGQRWGGGDLQTLGRWWGQQPGQGADFVQMALDAGIPEKYLFDQQGLVNSTGEINPATGMPYADIAHNIAGLGWSKDAWMQRQQQQQSPQQAQQQMQPQMQQMQPQMQQQVQAGAPQQPQAYPSPAPGPNFPSQQPGPVAPSAAGPPPPLAGAGNAVGMPAGWDKPYVYPIYPASAGVQQMMQPPQQQAQPAPIAAFPGQKGFGALGGQIFKQAPIPQPQMTQVGMPSPGMKAMETQQPQTAFPELFKSPFKGFGQE